MSTKDGGSSFKSTVIFQGVLSFHFNNIVAKEQPFSNTRITFPFLSQERQQNLLFNVSGNCEQRKLVQTWFLDY